VVADPAEARRSRREGGAPLSAGGYIDWVTAIDEIDPSDKPRSVRLLVEAIAYRRHFQDERGVIFWLRSDLAEIVELVEGSKKT
jgi:hypothetical protein